MLTGASRGFSGRQALALAHAAAGSWISSWNRRLRPTTCESFRFRL